MGMRMVKRRPWRPWNSGLGTVVLEQGRATLSRSCRASCALRTEEPSGFENYWKSSFSPKEKTGTMEALWEQRCAYSGPQGHRAA